jgi:transposase InsO family protein
VRRSTSSGDAVGGVETSVGLRLSSSSAPPAETVPLAVVRGMTMSMFHLSPSRVNFRGLDVSSSVAQRGRILRSEGLSRRRPPPSTQATRGQGVFKDYDLGFIHIDIKHLPKLRTGNGETRKRYLFVAIDRRSRSVHLAVKDDETEKSAIAFLREAAAAFPFRLTHVLTDNGSCFTPAFERACAQLGAEYRHTRPRTPQTNGIVERFNGRISSEVLGITIYSHRDLEQLLRGFNAAYNTRRQRVLDGKTPDQVVAERLEALPTLNRPQGVLQKRASPCDITKARFIAEAAKEVSQPDS